MIFGEGEERNINVREKHQSVASEPNPTLGVRMMLHPTEPHGQGNNKLSSEDKFGKLIGYNYSESTSTKVF